MDIKFIPQLLSYIVPKGKLKIFGNFSFLGCQTLRQTGLGFKHFILNNKEGDDKELSKNYEHKASN